MAQLATENTTPVMSECPWRGFDVWVAAPWGRPHEPEPGGRANVPDVWAGLGGLSGQTTAQDARRNGAAAREKRYADCGLEDMSAKSNGKRNIF